MYGIWGKLLEIDLTEGTSAVKELPIQTYRNFIGGISLGTKLLYEGITGATAPYSEDNLLIFTTGPFQGTVFPGSAKWMAISKSPLTGTFCASAAGANFGPTLKRTGYDAIVMKGKAERPVYILLTDERLAIRDASHLWGRDAIETNGELFSEFANLHPSIVTIGPAGEKQVAIACLVVDGHSFAGRGGLGAVMGSKNLKAVVVAGSKKVKVADPEGLKALTREVALQLRKASEKTYTRHGTANDVIRCEEEGDLPVKYWAGDVWAEGARKIGAPRFTEYLSAQPNPCFACPIGCHRHIKLIKQGEIIVEGAGPEYESLGMLGANCLVDDLDAIAVANDQCNRLGIDTISAGSYVAFTMECYERGLVKKEEVGFPVKWGDGDALLKLVDQIGTKKGFGAIFANGIRKAAQIIGGEALTLPVEVKGMDFPAHDPRTYFSLAINYATTTVGASHIRGFPHAGEAGMLIPEVGYDQLTERFTMGGKAWLTKVFQDYSVALDSLVDCIFMQTIGLSLGKTLRALNLITNWNFDVDTLMKVGERGFTLQRMINIRDGLTKQDDRLPARMFEPARQGRRKNKVPVPFEEALMEYYALRGWSKEGIPTQETLQNLGLRG